VATKSTATRAETRPADPPKARANARRTATPWGAAEVVEAVALRQQAGERRFSVVVELLETKGGERLVRVAYTSDGAVRRGPVTLRQREVAKLRAALTRSPGLAEAFEM
jgi:hypothetical protein